MTGVIIPVVALCLVVLLIPLTGMDYHLKRIVRFQKRRFKGGSGPVAFSILGEQGKQKLQVPLSDIRDLVVSLQLGTSMESTLTGSLAKAAEQFEHRGVLGERLRRNVDARLSTSPESVLEGLVQDLDCPQLEETLDRIRMAADGGISYNRVLAVSVESIEEDIRGNVETEIQKAPTQLTLPMVAGVFFPALVLGMLPLMVFAVNQMQSP